MSENNHKPDVFNKNVKKSPYSTEREVVSQEAIGGYTFKNEAEKEALDEMNRQTQRQIEARDAGISMGLSGHELSKYIIEATRDISVRPELAEDYGQPEKATLIYNTKIADSKFNEDGVPKPEFFFKEEKKDSQEPVDNVNYDEIAKNLIESKYNEDLEKEETLNKKTIDMINQEVNKTIEYLSIRQDDAPFDYVKIPSLGKNYSGVGEFIKIAYLNGSDEDVLTNPGVLSSGRFLEVLLTRKILEPNLKFDDLIPADRDAIMLWLRSTAYGSKYPIEVTNPETNKTFQAEVDLAELPVKYLDLEPNSKGFFEFTCTDGTFFEYKLLSMGDVKKLEQLIVDKAAKYSGLYTSSGSDEVLISMVRGLDKNYNKEEITPKLRYMRLKNIIEFKQHLKTHDFGVNLILSLQTPEGDVIETQFPFDTNFFWADI